MTVLTLAALDVCVGAALPVAEPEPEGEVEVGAATVEETGVTAASVAFLHSTLSGTVAESESVRSAHYKWRHGQCPFDGLLSEMRTW